MIVPLEQIALTPSAHSASLVGVSTYNKKFPLSFGNYMFIMEAGKEFTSCGVNEYYIPNMWAENLEEWIRQQPEHIPHLMGVKVKNLALIVDPRIPLIWLNRTLCFTGSYGYGQEEDRENLVDWWAEHIRVMEEEDDT